MPQGLIDCIRYAGATRVMKDHINAMQYQSQKT